MVLPRIQTTSCGASDHAAYCLTSLLFKKKQNLDIERRRRQLSLSLSRELKWLCQKAINTLSFLQLQRFQTSSFDYWTFYGLCVIVINGKASIEKGTFFLLTLKLLVIHLFFWTTDICLLEKKTGTRPCWNVGHFIVITFICAVSSTLEGLTWTTTRREVDAWPLWRTMRRGGEKNHFDRSSFKNIIKSVKVMQSFSSWHINK